LCPPVLLQVFMTRPFSSTPLGDTSSPRALCTTKPGSFSLPKRMRFPSPPPSFSPLRTPARAFFLLGARALFFFFSHASPQGVRVWKLLESRQPFLPFCRLLDDPSVAFSTPYSSFVRVLQVRLTWCSDLVVSSFLLLFRNLSGFFSPWPLGFRIFSRGHVGGFFVSFPVDETFLFFCFLFCSLTTPARDKHHPDLEDFRARWKIPTFSSF